MSQLTSPSFGFLRQNLEFTIACNSYVDNHDLETPPSPDPNPQALVL